MNMFIRRFLLLIGVCCMALSAFAENNLVLWYDEPAEEWTEALPVGNGRLGAMIFGGVGSERIQFNEDTVWTGVPRDYINPKAKETLPKVRQLLFEGKQSEAERVARDMMSEPLRQEAYQPFGDIILEFPGHEAIENYRRQLDISRALAQVSYQVDDITYRREVFSSFPDQTIVIRLDADQRQAINVNISLSSPHENVEIIADAKGSDGLLKLKGKVADYTHSRTDTLRPCAIRFESHLLIQPQGGSIEVDNSNIQIRNANAVIMKLCAATNYKNFRDIGNVPAHECEKDITAVANLSYDTLKQNHVVDYQSIFNRLSLDLGSTDAVNQPTNDRLKQFDGTNDPQLITLYYQYGRYLLLASSREGGQPANLQGIWNEHMRPPWESKWTVNINTEMNYWPAEMCNLSECHEPLFSMLEDLVVTGGNVAREHYGCRGWVLHHNTDIWRGAAPINASNHGIWMTGGAWLCQHLWFHYAYTQDEEFLRERAYPIMKGAALFFVDFLIEDPETGWLISTPSNSPEIGGLVAGPAMDHQIIRNLFSHCIQASEILDKDKDLRNQLKKLKERIAPNQIGQYGQLQEWLEDKDDPNNKHRHVSHLWALHPGNEITPLQTPELAEACKVTLSHRGDGGTGWSKAWKVNFWARLHDGNHAYKMLSELLTKSTLPNLFDTHPPFQIDGNFGGTSGITEMLLQSHAGEIHILPALPDALANGSIEGVCARGGFELDLVWENGELNRLVLTSKTGNDSTLRYKKWVTTIQTEKETSYVFDPELNQID